MTTKEKIAVMLAFEEGKTIEYNYRWSSLASKWDKVDDPIWDWNACNYRVKPEPREFYMLQYTSSSGEGYYQTLLSREETEKLARDYNAAGIKARVIKLREVLDES